MGNQYSKIQTVAKQLPTMFGRVGSKNPIKQQCIDRFPTGFKTYIEGFLGSGSVFLHSELPTDVKVVLNDLDKELIGAWNLIEKCPRNIPEGMLNHYKLRGNLKKARKLYAMENVRAKKHPKFCPPFWQPVHNLWREIARTTATFGSIGRGKIYKPTNANTKLARINDYQDKLANAEITNQNIFDVIDDNDNKDTFMYLDPPYENSTRLYTHGGFPLDDFADRLRKFKGKFLVSINDSPAVRKMFAGFKMEEIFVRAGGLNGAQALGQKSRDELFISNY